MRNPRHPRHMALMISVATTVLFWALQMPEAARAQMDIATCYLLIDVPETSEVYINGRRTHSWGPRRGYQASDVGVQRRCQFEIRVVAQVNGKRVQQVKRIAVLGGEEKRLRFEFPGLPKISPADTADETSVPRIDHVPDTVRRVGHKPPSRTPHRLLDLKEEMSSTRVLAPFWPHRYEELNGRDILPSVLPNHPRVMEFTDKTVLPVSANDRLVFWDTETGERTLKSFTALRKAVYNPRLSPDRQWMIEGEKIWDLRALTSTNLPLVKNDFFGETIEHAFFVANSKCVVIKGHGVPNKFDETVPIFDCWYSFVLIDAKTGQEVKRVGDRSEKHLNAYILSEDHRVLAASYQDGCTVWRLDTGEAIASLKSQFPLDLNREGTALASVGPEGVTVSNLAGVPKRTLIRMPVPLDCAQVSDDGRRLVTHHLDQTLRVWDVTTGQEQSRLKSICPYVFDDSFLKCSPDGGSVMVRSAGTTIRRPRRPSGRLFDAKFVPGLHGSWDPSRSYLGRNGPYRIYRKPYYLGKAAAHFPNQYLWPFFMLAGVDQKWTEQLSPRHWQQFLQHFQNEKFEVFDLVHLGQLIIWNAEKCEHHATVLTKVAGKVKSFATDHQGRFIALAGHKQTTIVDINGKKTVAELPCATLLDYNPADPEFLQFDGALQFNHAGSMLAVVTGREILVYDTTNWRLAATLKPIGGLKAVNGFCFSSDDSHLAAVLTGSDQVDFDDKGPEVYVWKLTDRRLICQRAIGGHLTQPTRLEFSPSGRLLAVAGRVRTVVLKGGGRNIVLDVEHYAAPGLGRVAFSHDETRINNGSKSWELNSKKLLTPGQVNLGQAVNVPVTSDRDSDCVFESGLRLIRIDLESGAVIPQSKVTMPQAIQAANGRAICTSKLDNDLYKLTVVVWRTGEVLLEIPQTGSWQLSSDGQMLAVSQPAAVALYDLSRLVSHDELQRAEEAPKRQSQER